MTCPPDIAAIILEIVAAGILRIRALAASGDATRCAIEADHLHNLPQLLRVYSPELLHYYWEVERPSFVSRSSKADITLFEPWWNKLGQQVSQKDGRVVA